MMKTAAVLASIVALPALAHAEELTAPSMQPIVVAAPPAPPPPQTDDWSNVSHINGQIVKVGERGDYLINNKFNTNVSANPFGFFFGYYDAGVTHKLSQNWAVAGSLTGWSYDHDYKTGYQASVSFPLYFRRTFSGPYLEPGLMMRSTSYNDTSYASCTYCTDSSYKRTWVGPELLFGWQVTYDSGLNVAAAFGVARHMSDHDEMSSTSYSSDSNKQDYNGYVRIGYAF